MCSAVPSTGRRQLSACRVPQQGLPSEQADLQHLSRHVVGSKTQYRKRHTTLLHKEADLQHPPSHMVSCRGPGRANLGLAHAEAGVIQLLLG